MPVRDGKWWRVVDRNALLPAKLSAQSLPTGAGKGVLGFGAGGTFDKRTKGLAPQGHLPREPTSGWAPATCDRDTQRNLW